MVLQGSMGFTGLEQRRPQVSVDSNLLGTLLIFFSKDESCWVDGSMSIPLAKGILLSKGTAYMYDIH